MFRSLTKYFHWFIYDSKILNWNQVHKCILVLLFFLFTKALWISWTFFALNNPEFEKFVNIETLHFHLKIETVEFFFVIGLIGILFFNQHRDWAQHFFVYFCIVLLITSLVFDWYSSGLLAAGTVINAMSFIYLLIVLFSRKTLLFTLVYATLVFIYFLNSGIVNGQEQYAPIFNLAEVGYPNFKNSFWLASTLYFSVPPFFVGVFILGTILRQWSARELYITQLSRMDGLTAVYNRRALNDFLLELDQQDQSHVTYAALLIDLDHFKMVNDTYGHIIGDKILINSAKILRDNIRKGDLVGRYGGEEFLIIIKNTHPYEIQRLAERCRQAVASQRHFINSHETIQVTCSIGIAFSDPTRNALTVLNDADQALYQAKTQGRNQVCLAE